MNIIIDHYIIWIARSVELFCSILQVYQRFETFSVEYDMHDSIVCALLKQTCVFRLMKCTPVFY